MDALKKKWFITAGSKPGIRRSRWTRGASRSVSTRGRGSGRGSGRGRLPSYITRVRRGTAKQVAGEVIREARVALLGATWRQSTRREAVFALLDGRRTTFELRQQHLFVDDVVPVDSETDSGTNSDIGSSRPRHSAAVEKPLPWTQRNSASNIGKQLKESNFDNVAFAAVRELDLTDSVSEKVLKDVTQQLKRFAETLAHRRASPSQSDEPTDKDDGPDPDENGVTQCRSPSAPAEKTGGTDQDQKSGVKCLPPSTHIEKSGSTDQDENGGMQYKSPSAGARRTAAYRTHAIKWLHYLVEGGSFGIDDNVAADVKIMKKSPSTCDEELAAERSFATNSEASQFMKCDSLPQNLAHVVRGAAKKETELLLKFMAHPNGSVAKSLVHAHGGAWNVVRAQLDMSSLTAVYGSTEENVAGIIPRVVQETFNSLQEARQVSFPDFVYKMGIHTLRPTQDEILQAFRYVRRDAQGYQVVWRLLELVCGVMNVDLRDAVSVTANLLKGINSRTIKQDDQSLTDSKTDYEVKALREIASETIPEICQRVTHLSFEDAMIVKQFASSFVSCDPIVACEDGKL